MNTVKEALARLNETLPGPVLSLDWDDPVLQLQGQGWRLTITTPWRLTNACGLLLASDDASATELTNVLLRETLVSCGAQSAHFALDPILIFSNGFALEVFSTTAMEPWILSWGEADLFVATGIP